MRLNLTFVSSRTQMSMQDATSAVRMPMSNMTNHRATCTRSRSCHNHKLNLTASAACYLQGNVTRSIKLANFCGRGLVARDRPILPFATLYGIS